MAVGKADLATALAPLGAKARMAIPPSARNARTPILCCGITT